MRNYFSKMRSVARSPERVPASEIFWSWFGGFTGILAVGLAAQLIHFNSIVSLFLIGSFGASAVLVYGVPNSNYAQPRNLVGGHLVSAFVGVLAYKLLPDPVYLSAALGVATAIAFMHVTKTLHPPGGATALIAVIGGPEIYQLGFYYVLMPVGVGAVIMLVVALLVNNIPANRKYPHYWR